MEQPSSSLMKTRMIEQDWQVLLTLLPADLEASAKALGALRRRRGVQSAAVLLRLAFAYAYCGLSLRAVAAWAAQVGIAQLSDVALLQRLRHASPWLGHLLAQKLAERLSWPQVEPGARLRRVRLLDATSLSGPGSQGTDWRVHLDFDLEHRCIVGAVPTTAKEGETLTRHRVEPADLVIADRGYAHRSGIARVAAAGGALIVGLNWKNVPLETPDGQPFDLLGAVAHLEAGEVAELAVQTAPDPKRHLPAVAGRVIVLKKSDAAAEEARRKLRRRAKRNGQTPDQRSLQAAAYVFLFTTVAPEQLDPRAVLSLYRFRWQVELTFKRLKSLLGLDELVARDEQLCRTFLLTKLLGMLLIEELTRDYLALSPWGYGLPATAVALAAVPLPGRDAAPGGGSVPDAGPMAHSHRSLRPDAARPAAEADPPEHASAMSTRHLPNALSLS